MGRLALAKPAKREAKWTQTRKPTGGNVTQDRDSGATSRRSLMAGFGAGAAFAAQPAWAQRRKLSPSDKVNVAMIGAGGQGASNGTKLTSQNIVATADVDYDHVKAALTDSKTGQIQASRQALKEAYDKATRY